MVAGFVSTLVSLLAGAGPGCSRNLTVVDLDLVVIVAGVGWALSCSHLIRAETGEGASACRDDLACRFG